MPIRTPYSKFVGIPEGRGKGGIWTLPSIPGVEISGVGTSGLTANRLYYYPIYVATPITLDRIAIEVTTAGAAATKARLGIYNANVNWQPTTLVLDAGTVAVDTTGLKAITISQTLPAGRYLLCLVSNGAPAVRDLKGGNRYIGYRDTITSTPFIASMYVSFTFGPLPATGILWDTIAIGSTPFMNMVFVRILTP